MVEKIFRAARSDLFSDLLKEEYQEDFPWVFHTEPRRESNENDKGSFLRHQSFHHLVRDIEIGVYFLNIIGIL
jgi:hypothetical protein